MWRFWVFPGLFVGAAAGLTDGAAEADVGRFGDMDRSCDANPQACDDTFGALQLRKTRPAALASGAEGQMKTAFAFQGGGFESVANQAAILAALIAAATPAGAEPSITGSQLFDKFDILSSVSGGGWFLSALLYSPHFVKMIEKMAASPDSSAAIFDAEYMDPWFDKGKETAEGPLKVLAEIFQSLNIPQISDSLFWGGEILSLDGWSGFIQQLLQYTTNGDITNTTTMGESLPWADGKTWLACHSVISPVASNEENDRALLYLSEDLTSSYIYRMNGRPGQPLYIPAKFSVPLGAGLTASAPLPYIAAEALPDSSSSQWTASFDVGLRKDRMDSPQHDQFFNFTNEVNSMHVYNAVAAASAAAAGIVLVDGLRDISARVGENLGPRLAVWAAAARDRPFLEADALLDPIAAKNTEVSKATMAQIAGAGVLPMADGVYTDNSGIGQAVASGATEVTAFVSAHSLSGLFRTSPKSKETFSGYKMSGVVPANNFPIFDFEDLHGFPNAQDYLAALIGNFSAIGSDTMQFATPIQVGTVRCITMANPWFGTPAKLPVTLNVIIGGTNLGVGAFRNLHNYAASLQGIVESLTDATQKDSDALKTLYGFFKTPTVSLYPPSVLQRSSVARAAAATAAGAERRRAP